MGLIKSSMQTVVSFLLADPYFANIPVFKADEKELNYLIQKAVGSVGVCVIVMTARMKRREKIKKYFNITMLAEVRENPIINRGNGAQATNKEASEIAEYIAAIMDDAYPDTNAAAYVVDDEAVSFAAENPDESLVIYHTAITTHGGLNLGTPQSATPTLTDNGAGLITLSCSTLGAAMFYTLDGTNPSARSGTLYTGPFTLNAGVTLKVRSWIWGYTVSEENQYIR
jgi:hypothetical protein